MSKHVKTPNAERVPDRKPGPEQRDEYLRIWDAASDNVRKKLIFCSRAVEMDDGLVPPGTPLMITDRVF
ncbi:hypothetical protein [Neoroseomonas oryzicola]|uniref:Uncharacterized protein n=1 Tax=Neoroseomonas oryzicola TaxID=535904 RepID=A0A9X9WED3_9PROT|nr:hypothetical protein [Neoroseomonas oryzicola]MBR0658693.1 hypothetical protein [Neoroseomonas oryzicola]NKE17871.1 hypothetical protein [Neoroseomonas oryzicola]